MKKLVKTIFRLNCLSLAGLLMGLSGNAAAQNLDAQNLYVKDAVVITGTDQGRLENTDLIIENGQITAMGADLTVPNGAQQITGAGLWVTSGIFAPLSMIGLIEIGAEDDANDGSSPKSNMSISELAVDSFNSQSPVIDISRVSGITHAAIVNRPSHDLFSGTGMIANMSGDFDSVMSAHSFIYVQLGVGGADLAGGSRSSALAQLRAALNDAGAYPSRYKGPEDGDTLRRRDAAAFARAARGFMPLVIGADRASDMLRIIALKRNYSELDIIIAGAAEGWMVADELAQAGIKVMVDPHNDLPADFDQVAARLDNAALLDAAGVELAIFPRSAGLSHNVRVIRQHAGNAVAQGLSWDTAFAAISSVPAKWYGQDLGQITQDSPANLVVWDGDPLEVTSHPVMIMIGGQQQSLKSRQTELRDRYHPLSKDTRHFKYR